MIDSCDSCLCKIPTPNPRPTIKRELEFTQPQITPIPQALQQIPHVPPRDRIRLYVLYMEIDPVINAVPKILHSVAVHDEFRVPTVLVNVVRDDGVGVVVKGPEFCFVGQPA